MFYSHFESVFFQVQSIRIQLEKIPPRQVIHGFVPIPLFRSCKQIQSLAV